MHGPTVTLTPPRGMPAAGGQPVRDNDMTQPMRFPTGTLSAAQKEAAAKDRAPKALPSPHGPTDDTAIIDMSGAVKASNTDGAKDGDQQ